VSKFVSFLKNYWMYILAILAVFVLFGGAILSWVFKTFPQAAAHSSVAPVPAKPAATTPATAT
jgi:hypothetical protein